LVGAASPEASHQYPETFTETGLPSGLLWNVTLNGQTLSAVAPSSIVFSEPNGTYGYTIGGPFGWQLVRPSATGTVHVAGAPNTVVVPSIGVGGSPVAVAFDPSNGYLYVANPATDNLTVIDGATDTVVVPSIVVGNTPVAVAFDPSNGYLYVANYWSANLTVIDGATDTVVVPSIGVGSNPDAVAFDPSNGYLYVSNAGSNNVTVIDGATDAVVVPSIGVGTDPYAVAFDPSNGDLYVANLESDDVTVIDGATDTVVVPSIGVGVNPDAVASDPSNGDLYVANANSNNLTVIDGATDAVVVPSIGVESEPYGIAFDPSNGYLYVTNAGSNNVTVIDGATDTVVVPSIGVGSEPNGIAFDSSNGYLYVTNSGSNNVTVIDGNGLMASEWKVAPDYSVIFTETGLPSGTSWLVTLRGTLLSSTTSTITFTEPNGSYPYTITDISGWHQTTLPYVGAMMVSGAAVTEPTLAFTQVTYSITFTESGLPSDTEWWVNLSSGPSFSSTSTTLTFSEPNGTYDYMVATADKEYAPAPASGSFGVSGASVSKSVTFSLVTYTVTFTETDLPTGTEWWVNVTGQPSHGSTTATVTLSLSNGTYPYTFATTNKSYQSPGGKFTVSGASVSESVTFSLVTYTVTFTETGLPSGMNWTVTLNGVQHASTTATITFAKPNDTYSFSVGSVTGYTVNLSSGSITVSGAAIHRSVAFTSTSGAATFLGLPAAEGYALLGAIVAVVLVGVAVTVVLIRRRRKTPPNPVSSPSQPGAGSPPVPP
jgi:YVTN family beta-propeller protein